MAAAVNGAVFGRNARDRGSIGSRLYGDRGAKKGGGSEDASIPTDRPS